jgi:hypothetical protein
MKKIARSRRQHRELNLNYFRAQKLLSSGVVEGLKQQGQSHYEKIVRLSHLPSPRTCTLSVTWQAARAGIHPRFLLTSPNLGDFWNVSTRPVRRNGFGLSIQETGTHVKSIERTMTLLPEIEEVYRSWRRLLVTHDVRGV